MAPIICLRRDIVCLAASLLQAIVVFGQPPSAVQPYPLQSEPFDYTARGGALRFNLSYLRFEGYFLSTIKLPAGNTLKALQLVFINHQAPCG